MSKMIYELRTINWKQNVQQRRWRLAVSKFNNRGGKVIRRIEERNKKEQTTEYTINSFYGLQNYKVDC